MLKNNETLIKPEEIMIEPYVKGECALEITYLELNNFGECLQILSQFQDQLGLFDKTKLSMLRNSYETMYNRVMSRGGELASTTKLKKRIAELEDAYAQTLS